MSINIVAILETLLSQARRERADAVRLLSDLHPVLVTGGKSRAVLGYELGAMTIFGIHSECVARSEMIDLEFRSNADYQFLSEKFGLVRCKYASQGNVVSLSIFLEELEPEIVPVKRPNKPPPLRAEAKPGEAGPRSTGRRRRTRRGDNH
jgi:hypothetical protein